MSKRTLTAAPQGLLHPRRSPRGRASSVAVDGLPGVGKTALIEAVAGKLGASVLEEVLLDDPIPAAGDMRALVARNDALKEKALRRHSAGILLLDRYWPSAIAYALARGADPRPRPEAIDTTIGRIYGRGLTEPSAYVLLRASAERLATPSGSGLWADAGFCMRAERGFARIATYLRARGRTVVELPPCPAADGMSAMLEILDP